MSHQLRCFSNNVAKELVRKNPLLAEFMSAWQCEKFGGLDQLSLKESLKIPELTKPHDLRIRVLASAVNPLDLYMLGGYGSVVLSFLKKFYLACENKEACLSPLILGRDFCGEVIFKGPKARKNIKLGDIVYGVVPPHLQGSHAEQLTIDDCLVSHKHDQLLPFEAASIPYSAMTAWSALKITGDLAVIDPKSQRVLVIGASGGVGSAAVQLLKAWGSTVVGTCSPDAVPLVESLNADLVIDYTRKESLREIELAGKYDIILDASGNINNSTYIPFLKDWSNSKLITLRSPFLKNTDNLGLVGGLVKNVASLGESNLTTGALAKGATVRWGFFAPLGAALQEIDSLVRSGQLKAVIDSVFKYEEMSNAYKRVSQGHLRGKVVVSHE